MTSHDNADQARPVCAIPPRELNPAVAAVGDDLPRMEAIRRSVTKWANGTVLNYCFLARSSWDWPEAQKAVVREAFQTWKLVGIGLDFAETADESEAHVLIGRLLGDGSWSYVGREILSYRDADRTMNFGWDLSSTWGRATAIHEIGHTLGLEHEHQNPNAGIVWDEEAVYAELLRTNGWDRAKTKRNIIDKLAPNEAEGSQWDHTSIMHYPFRPGLMKLPRPYDVIGVGDNIVLSNNDKAWARYWYPSDLAATPIAPGAHEVLPANAGAQRNFTFEPDATRSFTMNTNGVADTTMVLFEEHNGKEKLVAGSDDCGTDTNSSITVELKQGSRYHIRVRTAYAMAERPPTLTLR